MSKAPSRQTNVRMSFLQKDIDVSVAPSRQTAHRVKQIAVRKLDMNYQFEIHPALEIINEILSKIYEY